MLQRLSNNTPGTYTICEVAVRRSDYWTASSGDDTSKQQRTCDCKSGAYALPNQLPMRKQVDIDGHEFWGFCRYGNYWDENIGQIRDWNGISTSNQCELRWNRCHSRCFGMPCSGGFSASACHLVVRVGRSQSGLAMGCRVSWTLVRLRPRSARQGCRVEWQSHTV
ncbi:uncharacterized protein BDZ99DRAFT_465214 [Mytilinidion resinicola]|uniref:Uncharacterized protein n=1 Tax=Mytilinidion resinicola TaxID=574789 RepID=A0A6A6YH15_9PEZI|nr:uncharacterized protein BDZ99DRAFT_465214 [Mytilinidion resinicola]KAF2807305.1 hypothetical protein BDZ99DRAFT_465214 [Mytilinidion resinicola]